MRDSASILSALLAVCVAVPAAAQVSVESLGAGAEAQLGQAFLQAQGFHRAVLQDQQAAPAAPAAPVTTLEDDQSLPVHMYSPAASVAVGTPKTLAKQVDLGALLNRHLKTNLTFTLGGVSVWMSGAFDRQQNAYVSLLIDGQAVQYFNVTQLLTSPKFLDIGTAKYRLSVSPDLTDQLQSEIVLTNAANRRDQQRVTLQDMLTAVAAAGEDINVAGQDYKLFYYDDVAGASRSFALIYTDAQGAFHVFLIPAEIVPSGAPATFKLYNSLPLALQQSNGILKVFQQ